MFVGELELGDVAVFAASAGEFEEILKECDEFVLALAVGEEEGEEDGEVAGADEDFLGDFFCEIFGVDCVLGQILGGGASQRHLLYYK